MDRQEQLALTSLIRGQRWAALATLSSDGAPYGSYVAYTVEPDLGGFLLHLSRLAPHTNNLLANQQASLAISEPDAATDADPQTLARVSIKAEARVLEPDSSQYLAAKGCYLDRLPAAAQLFTFSDFVMFRMVPTELRFVAGFAKTSTVTLAQLEEIVRIDKGQG